MKNTDRVLSQAARGVGQAIPLDVQKMDVHGMQANVLLRVSPRIAADEETLSKAVASAFDGKVRLLHGSAHRPSADPSLVLACVELCREIRPFDDGGVKGLTAVTANVFRDEGDNIWRKAGDDLTAVLVKDTADEIEAILSSRQSLSIATASTKVDLHEEASIGHGIGWLDAAQEKMRFGIKCGPGVVFDISSQSVHEVADHTVFVVQAHEAAREVATQYSELFGKGKAPLSRDNGMGRYLAYMGTLFNKRDTYYKRLEGLMKTAFGTAALRAQ